VKTFLSLLGITVLGIAGLLLFTDFGSAPIDALRALREPPTTAALPPLPKPTIRTESALQLAQRPIPASTQASVGAPTQATPGLVSRTEVTASPPSPTLANGGTAQPRIRTPTPETSTPEISTPETSTPEISTPEISTPEISTPEISTPEISIPEISILGPPALETLTPGASTPKTPTSGASGQAAASTVSALPVTTVVDTRSVAPVDTDVLRNAVVARTASSAGAARAAQPPAAPANKPAAQPAGTSAQAPPAILSNRGSSQRTATAAAQATSKVAPEVLERAEPAVLASTLSELTSEAIAALPPKIVQRLAHALTRDDAPTSPATRGGISPPGRVSSTATTSLEGKAASGPASTAPGTEGTDAARVVAQASRKRLATISPELLAQAVAAVKPEDLAALSEELRQRLPVAVEAARSELRLDADANAFITTLVPPERIAIPAARANHFVRPTQSLDLSSTIESQHTATLRELLALPDVDAGATIEFIRTAEERYPLDIAALARATPSELAKPIRIVDKGNVVEVPIREALARQQLKPLEPLTVVSSVRRRFSTTLSALRLDASVKLSEPLTIIERNADANLQLVKDLLGQRQSDNPDSLYYIRTVGKNDVQGIWGIIQSGLIDNFAAGVAFQRGTSAQRYRVEIPVDADEPLRNTTSSFLGRLIHAKTAASTVYNIGEGRISTDPNLIRPGQQIVIVDFTPQELTAIYRHFARQDSTRSAHAPASRLPRG
jgi:hypothetical protein